MNSLGSRKVWSISSHWTESSETVRKTSKSIQSRLEKILERGVALES